MKMNKSVGSIENSPFLEISDFILDEQSSISGPKSLLPQANNPENIHQGQISVARPLSAFQAIAATLVVLQAAQEEYWLTEEWVRTMGNRCYQQQYEGDWATLQVILQTSTNFQEAELIAIELLGPRTYYGNAIPTMKRYMQTIRLKQQKRNKRVRQKIRRRGYNDKGHRIEAHERHGIPGKPEREIPLLDFRQLIIHPLLLDTEKTKTQVGNIPIDRVLEIFHDLQEQVRRRKEMIKDELLRDNGPDSSENGSYDAEKDDAGGGKDDKRTTPESSSETGSKETSSQKPVRQESQTRE